MQRSLLNFFSRASKTSLQTLDQVPNKVNVTENAFQPMEVGQVDFEEELPMKLSRSGRKRTIIESSDEEESSCVINTAAKENFKPSFNRNKESRLSGFSCSSPKLSRKSVTSDSDTLSRSLNETIGDNIVEASDVNDSVVDGEAASWEHLKLPFLKKENLMDSARRKPSHPDYDPRTLFVPGDFLAKQSPGMRQWWELKSKYADAILFFKVGKFYEMYHMDAAVGVEHLGLVYMKGSFAHCGFPEIAFSRMSEQLVKKGYKVARVEQTESVDAMTERTRGRPGSEKVVKREVCQLSTPGTCTTSMRTELSYSSNATVSDSEDGAVSTEALDTAPESFLLAIGEETSSGSSEHVFGVALLNAINGTILMGQFHDDRHCGRLRTLISHYFPSQIIVEKGSVSHSIKILLKTCLSGVPVEYLTHGKQFWSAKETIIELETAGYFSSAEHGKQQSISDSRHYPLFPGKENWPGTLVRMLSEDDPLGRSVKTDYDLAMSCLGAIVYYLRYCLIDRQVMSLGLIDLYMPPDCLQIATTTGSGQVFYSRQTSLVLDSITLANLDILHNSVTGTREGTLLERLDTCCTPFGRRLLRQWLTAPPCNPKLIRARQDAVDNLIDIGGQLNSIKLSLRRLPDFERLLTKIHLVGSKKNEKNHPDARAILFEEVQYSRRNIVDFLATLHGFEVACEIITQLESFSLCAPLLRALTKLEADGGQFPDLRPKIVFFMKAFDAEKAKRDGRITPEPGVDEDYDEAVREIQTINSELDTYLIACGKRFGIRLAYWGTGRNRFQLEVPDCAVSRVPRDWQLVSQRKGVKRYRTDETTELLGRLIAAEDRKDASLRNILQTIFASFSDHFTLWHSAMRCLAEFDCLLALANYSSNASDVTCRPEFIDLTNGSQQPFLEIVDGLHPCLINTFSGGDLIPNDTRLGITDSNDPGNIPLTLLVTGPNMGGKSTLMRQTALLVILAHLGCRIPASFCRLTPVDRVFSRLGASDRLLAGESTFMVELAETAAILRHCTPHSLVLMDELGRGTSTHDGAALASAVLHYLANPGADQLIGQGPRTLFSTHYHSLVDEVALGGQQSAVARIGLGHMACMVEEQSEAEAGLENITFLYKFIPGACPKSYGFNAARLAHLPDEVIQLGLAKAKEFERTSATFACLRKLLSGTMNWADAVDWKKKLHGFD
ncbi:DNA mismatch repair protein msh6 [Clonorchis sinensis]|uniref:DNA mismatch repair protein n=1 Tax=Clonorchis sinensis TaxID=79923 RepID=A0A8T1MRZ2_CLOSI|nr:DNA mismatch repair protein msh6 [Clonorchis sinensis]